MIRCTLCVMPNTRPDTLFVDGVCSACLAFARRAEVDWDARRTALEELLERHKGRVIVPSSGGKDSTYQVMALRDLGATPVVVTAITCHLTPIGRANIDNLARFATTYEVSPNKKLRASLNRMALEMVGDPSWPEHVSIFTTPFRMACALKIPLIMYGENPQAEYGGPSQSSQEAREMTRRWVSEFGGFLGLRPADFQTMGYDMADYFPPPDKEIAHYAIEAHFLGQYIPWDSERNATVASSNGMQWRTPSPANWWPWENLDNAQTGLHDYLMYRKYGFGRGCQQISVDVRNGRVTRAAALEWVDAHDGTFNEEYAGVSMVEVLERIDVTRAHMIRILDQFTDWKLFRRVMDDVEALPMRID